jgi:4-hydroxy-2-oxoglutarate aldolase
MSQRFAGIYAALLTPFENDGIALGRFRDNIRRYDAFGLAGYVVLGSTGECVSITDDEAAALVKAAREAAAPGKTIIAGTARESTRLTIEFTKRAADLGAEAALIRTPSYFKSRMTREVLKTYFLDAADASPVPVIVYNVPANTGISLEGSLILELSAHPNIAGLKESGGNIVLAGEILPRLPSDFSYLPGHGSAFLSALILGASGAILAVANAAPAVCVEIYEHFKAGKVAEAVRRQLDLVPLNKTLMETYGVPGLKYAVELQGWYGGQARRPLLPIDDKGRAEIKSRLEALGLV